MSYNIRNEKFTANHHLYSLLSKATNEEALQLTRILKDDDKEPYENNTPLATNTLCHEITIAGGNSFTNKLRHQGNSYWDILDDIAKVVLKKQKFKRYSQIKDYDDISFYNKKMHGTCKTKIHQSPKNRFFTIR